MATYDLICYLPSHGYSQDDPIFVSWLEALYYVEDPDTDSFKLIDSLGGQTVQYTEDIIDGYFRQIDSDTGVAEITGLGHLEGELVTVTAFGVNLGAFSVTNAKVAINQNIYTYQVGLKYAAKLRTMRFSVPGVPGLRTKIKRIIEVSSRVYRTKGGQMGQEIDGTEYTENIGAEYSNESTDYKILNHAGFNPDGYTVAKSNDPFPMTVLGTTVELET